MEGLLGLYTEQLGKVFGEHAALTFLTLVVIASAAFSYFVKVRLGPNSRYRGSDTATLREKQNYFQWRQNLAGGGAIGERYTTMLSGALDGAARFFGDKNVEPGRPRFWSGPALDRCFGLAVAYPILTILIIWFVTGYVGDVEAALQLEEGVTPHIRALSALSMLFFIATVCWLTLWKPAQRRFIWGVIRLLGIAGAYAFIVTVANEAGVQVTLTATGTLAIALLLARVGAGAVAVAVAVAGAFILLNIATIVGKVTTVSAMAMAAAVSAARKFLKRHRLAGLGFALVYLGGIAVLVRFLPGWLGTTEPLHLPGWVGATEPLPWTLLCFLGALPLVNALYDWISIGFTRWLLSFGLHKKDARGVLFAMVDLVVATLLLGALMITCITYIEWLNRLSIAGGGEQVLNIRQLLDDLRDNPGHSSLWWVYVTIFTTYIPSMFNLVLGGLSVVRGIPGINGWISAKVLPTDPSHMTVVERFAASAWLAAQVVVAIVGAVLLGLFILFGLLDVLQMVGLGLLNMAEHGYALAGGTYLQPAGR